MKIFKHLSTIGFIAFLVLLVFTACNSSEDRSITTKKMALLKNETGQSFPEPNPFAFPVKNPTNMDFHEISWAYFLWLTDTVENGKLRFETMYTDKAIQPEHQDDTDHILGGVQQAGSDGIVIDHNGRAVYTNMIIDGVYRDFVLKNQLYEDEKLVDFPAETSFPIGSLSLKAAWKIVEPGEDVSTFYTTKAKIQLLETVSGKVKIPDGAKVEEGVDVALVGFHIAIVVNGHPEAIWATFEHESNAPSFKKEQKPNDPVSNKNFTFYTADTAARYTNVNALPVLKLNQETQKITPVTQVARQYEYGGGSSNNQGNIQHINDSIHQKVLSEKSIWKHYYEVGAIWFNKPDTLEPNWDPAQDPSIMTGSLTLSNALIETYTQNVVSQNNCFSCHNTMAMTFVPKTKKIVPGKNVLTSHILLKNYLEGKAVKRN